MARHFVRGLDVRDYASLNAAITAAGADVTDLHIPDGASVTLTGNATVPATLTLRFSGGEVVVGAYALTINSPFYAAGWRQLFDVSGGGSVTFAAGTVARITPQWFGAVGDGTTDDSTAVTACLTAANAARAEAYFPKATYAVSRLNLSGFGYLTIKGQSRATIIQPSVNGTAGQAFVQLGEGSGGTGGTHNTSQIHLTMDNITFLANGKTWDYGMYADNLTDSTFRSIRLWMGDVGLHLNYSWLNTFYDLDIQYFQDVGVQITNNSVNGIRFIGGRLSGANSPAAAVGWDIQGGNTIEINADCESCGTGMRVGPVKNLTVTTHFEGCDTQVLYNYNNLQTGTLNLIGCLFYVPTTYAIKYDTSAGTQTAKGLNVIGCTFVTVPAGGVTLLASSGIWSGNNGDSGIISQHGSNRMHVEVGGRMHRSYGFTDTKQVSALSTTSGSPTAIFTNIPVDCVINVTARQQLSGTNTAGWKRTFAVAPNGALNSSAATTISTDMGLVFSYASGTLSCYGTYAAACDFTIEVTGRATTL